ncbi:MAG: radical SAM protein [Thermoproteaceae archaeon]|jgi:DNA repair photolyase|nr:radical SAM protein [Thermoproteaceae archaeon]
MPCSYRAYEIRARQALVPSRLPEYDYALNPYAGCSHACIYCYAADLTRGPPGSAWGEVVYVKKNVPELLKREVRRLAPGVVGLSTVTDPYQPAEREYMLARASLEVLAGAGFRVSIQTKSDLVLRDLDVIVKYRHAVDVGFTITSLGERASAAEPCAPSPLARARAAEILVGRGVRVWIFLGPIIPGYNDSARELGGVIALARRIGAELVYDRYRATPRAGARLRAALGAGEPSPEWWRRVRREVEVLCAREGARCRSMEEEWGLARRDSKRASGGPA